MSADPARRLVRPKLSPSKSEPQVGGRRNKDEEVSLFSFSADFKRLLELPMDETMRSSLLQTITKEQQMFLGAPPAFDGLIRPSPWSDHEPPLPQPPALPSGASPEAKGEDDLLLTRFRMAEAEAEAEELSDRLRVAEFEVEESELCVNKLALDKEGLRDEINMLRRELEVAKKERDDAIGGKYLAEKEAKKTQQQARLRSGTIGSSTSPDIQRLEEEMVDLKVKLTDALAKNAELEKERDDARSSVAEIKYELARAHSLYEDKEAEVNQLKQEVGRLKEQVPAGSEGGVGVEGNQKAEKPKHHRRWSSGALGGRERSESSSRVSSCIPIF